MKLKGKVIIDNKILEDFLSEYCRKNEEKIHIQIKDNGDEKTISFVLNGTDKEIESIEEEIFHIIRSHIVTYDITQES
jgi:hypothetical protein